MLVKTKKKSSRDWRQLESSLFVLIKLHFQLVQCPKISWPWHIAFSTSSKSVFWASPQVQNKLRMPGEPLKHPFFDLTQVTFWDVQEAWKCVKSVMRPLETLLSRLHQFRILGWSKEENEFPVPGEHLIYRFLDLIKVEFRALQEVEKDF